MSNSLLVIDASQLVSLRARMMGAVEVAKVRQCYVHFRLYRTAYLHCSYCRYVDMLQAGAKRHNNTT